MVEKVGAQRASIDLVVEAISVRIPLRWSTAHVINRFSLRSQWTCIIRVEDAIAVIIALRPRTSLAVGLF